jgi:hypothetical protein
MELEKFKAAPFYRTPLEDTKGGYIMAVRYYDDVLAAKLKR